MNPENPQELMDGIDPMIQDLIKAMNAKGLITTSSCQGHLGKRPAFREPYVECHVPAEMLGWLAAVLSGVDRYFRARLYESYGCTFYLDAHWAYNEEANNSQEDAPPGYVALSLTFAYYPHKKRCLEGIQREVIPSLAYVLRHFPDERGHDVDALVRRFYLGAK